MKKLEKCELGPDYSQAVTDARFSKTAPTQLFHILYKSESQRTFDKDPRTDEDQEMCTFGL